MSILLGFEIPNGRRVEIPDEGHAAFFGQTQLSGKTTLIEAITYRAPANVKAVAFITKRGEGSFLTGRMIPPYFSEPTNDPEQPLWRWVSAILEASQSRKLRFEESWIIKACEEPERATSLADVHENIQSLLEGQGDYIQKGRGKKRKSEWKWTRKPVTGINQGVYTSLKAYFDIVMPQLQRMPYTKTLKLTPGLNVMDLREYSMEAQGMVIRSVMEYVYRHERNTRVVVPEAQDFVPQGKNSPVKMACETMVRKGAADKNFMWLDSQDMAAVDKVMLRAVSILGVGVQGEAHEMGRAIAHLFGAATRLTPRDIGSLQIGQFYLRLAGGEVTKVYVQPAWMDSEVHARAIAMGQEPVSSARQILKKFKTQREANNDDTAGVGICDGQTDAERQEKSFPCDQESEDGESPETESVDLRGNRGWKTDSDRQALSPDAAESDSGLRDGLGDQGRNDAMWEEKYKALEKEHATLIEAHDALAAEVRRLRQVIGKPLSLRSIPPGSDGRQDEGAGAARVHSEVDGRASAPANSTIVPSSAEMNFIYQEVKMRAAADPGILELLTRRPELRVTIERQLIVLDGKTLKGALAILISEKFFDNAREFADVRKELIRRGFLGSKAPNRQISQAIQGLVEAGFLTAEDSGFQAVKGMKVNLVERNVRSEAMEARA